MAVPQLVEQSDGGNIKLYAGDPKWIRLRLPGQDLSSRRFTAQIRAKQNDPTVIASFTVSMNVVDGAEAGTKETIIDLKLRGDSAEGVTDAQTRLPEGVRSAYFDVQSWGLEGAATTIAWGILEQQRDVTR